VRFQLAHETRYSFSQPVTLEPHLLRLIPRQDTAQRLESFGMTITPEPAGWCDIEDLGGNPARQVWFLGTTEQLLIRTEFVAETLRANPFDYLLDSWALKLPFKLPVREHAVLAPYLHPSDSSAVRVLARELLAQTCGETTAFLNALNNWIYEKVHIVTRLEPGVRGVDETLKTRVGACRDVTLLFLCACREAGIPARYVSGYQLGDPEQIERDLHAYPEVFLPGAGWRAYDPTLGLVVADEHLALCASPLPELTAAVTGAFRGTGATSTMTHAIRIKRL